MTVPFTQVPANIRTPLFFAELDNSQANSGVQQQRSLIIGQMLAAGTATANVPVLMQGTGWAKGAFGQGSQLALMADWYRKRDGFGEVWCLPLADAAGTAATGTVTFTAAATSAGTFFLYVGGMLVAQPVLTTQTVTQLATALAAQINANPDLPVTAASLAGAVTLTARNKGTLGNGIDLRYNYQGAAGGEVLPVGLAVTLVQMASGATDPTLTTALTNLADKSFDFIVLPYTDSTSLNAIRDLLAARWSATSMIYGGAFAAAKGSAGTLQTLGAARNDPHVSIIGFNDSPTPAWLWAANFAGAAAFSLRNDPALPLQTLALDVLAPPVASRFDLSTRNTLLQTGISTFTSGDDGTVRLETIITNYLTNPYGVADDSYLYIERLYTLAAVIRRLNAKVTSTYGRMKLADDGTNFRPGSNIVTPAIIRDTIVAEYRSMERDGLVQNSAQFKANIIVQRNASNRCRVDGVLPVVPIDQLRQLCALVQFRNSVG